MNDKHKLKEGLKKEKAQTNKLSVNLNESEIKVKVN